MRWLRRWIRRHDHWGGLHGCQVLLAAVVPQPDLDVIWWPQLVLLAGQVGELRGRQTVALVPVLLGGGAHRHERGLQRPHRQGRLVLVRDGRGLAPDDRGKDTTVPDKDQPTLAMWALKTTLMAMRSSSQQDRDQGYGLPPTEFTDLPRQKDQLRPPDHVQVWLGHYSGQQHLASVQATPMIVTADPPAEPAHPHA